MDAPSLSSGAAPDQKRPRGEEAEAAVKQAELEREQELASVDAAASARAALAAGRAAFP